MFKHYCTLDHGSGSCLPRLPKNASCIRKILRSLRKLTLVSPRHSQCHEYFKSIVSINRERNRHIQSELLYIIHPFSLFRLYWENVMMIVLFLSLVVYTFHVSFYFGENLQFGWLNCFLGCLDCICLADIVVTYFTGYAIVITKEVVLDPFKIARRYLCSSIFIIDFLSSIPVLLLHPMLSTIFSDEVWIVFNTFSLLKLFRLRTFLIYLERAADLWQISSVCYSLIHHTLIVLLTIHWTTCTHYVVPYMIGYIQTRTRSVHQKSWISFAHLDDYPTYIRYSKCLFRTCCILFNISHGPYDPVITEDAILIMATFIAGAILGATVLVVALQMIAASFSAETKYQEIMKQVQEYMGYKQLPLSMQKRVEAFYEYRFQKSYFRENTIAATLSVRLRREINVFCCQRLIDSVSIFKHVPQSLLADIVNSLKAEIFLPNDIIVKAGTIGECMYFLSTGTVCVITPNGKEVCHLYDGAYFGEIALIMKDQTRIANVIAIEICEVYKLDRKSFKSCFVSYPELYLKVEVIAQERRENTIAIEEVHTKYLMALEAQKINAEKPL